MRLTGTCRPTSWTPSSGTPAATAASRLPGATVNATVARSGMSDRPTNAAVTPLGAERRAIVIARSSPASTMVTAGGTAGQASFLETGQPPTRPRPAGITSKAPSARAGPGRPTVKTSTAQWRDTAPARLRITKAASLPPAQLLLRTATPGPGPGSPTLGVPPGGRAHSGGVSDRVVPCGLDVGPGHRRPDVHQVLTHHRHDLLQHRLEVGQAPSNLVAPGGQRFGRPDQGADERPVLLLSGGRRLRRRGPDLAPDAPPDARLLRAVGASPDVQARPLLVQRGDVGVLAHWRESGRDARGVGQDLGGVHRAQVVGAVADVAHDRSRVERHLCHHPSSSGPRSAHEESTRVICGFRKGSPPSSRGRHRSMKRVMLATLPDVPRLGDS